eukprot:538928-Rhodomonas_salina.1
MLFSNSVRRWLPAVVPAHLARSQRSDFNRYALPLLPSSTAPGRWVSLHVPLLLRPDLRA